jgi:cyanophycin synthetase
MDVEVGAYDDISSAESDGFVERLVSALPGLEEHRCSIGSRGGFVTRLHRGTYAPHIIEHVALELQVMVGHRVGYGRTRGGDADGQYTVVVEHEHQATGMRAAALALDVVQQAFAGTLAGVTHVVSELRSIASMPDVPPITPRVTCGITGGSGRAELRQVISEIIGSDAGLVVDVSPGFLLQAGLPYAKSRVAVVTDTELTDVPERYRERDRAERLVSVLGDGVERDGLLIAPAAAWDVQDHARRANRPVAVFSGSNDITRKDKKVAVTAAWVSRGEIIVEHRGQVVERLPLAGDLSPHLQAAAAVALNALGALGAAGRFTARHGYTRI